MVPRGAFHTLRVVWRRRAGSITGIDGQDGSYLAELLLAEGYEVTGDGARTPARDAPTSPPCASQLALVAGDLLDPPSLRARDRAARPHELYHLAAPTFVPASWDDPAETSRRSRPATADAARGRAAAEHAVRVWRADVERGVRRRRRVAAARALADAPAQPLRRREARRARARRGAARASRAVRVLGDHLQPRVPAPPASTSCRGRSPARRGGDPLGLECELVLGDLSAIRDWSHAARRHARRVADARA